MRAFIGGLVGGGVVCLVAGALLLALLVRQPAGATGGARPAVPSQPAPLVVPDYPTIIPYAPLPSYPTAISVWPAGGIATVPIMPGLNPPPAGDTCRWAAFGCSP